MAVPDTEETTLKADPAAQRRLLDLQALDARADQLRHQMRTLPEHAEVETAERQRKDVDDRLRDARILADDLAGEQRKADADVEQVRARRDRDRRRIDEGLVSNPKDLERMQHELVALERRIDSLEETELEVMERQEDAQRERDQLEGQLAALDEELQRLTASRDEKAGRIRADAAEVGGQREAVVAGLPDDLLALYEKLRANKGGVGAAELRARQCGGCRLTLDHAELASIKTTPEDEVVRCEECQRILVRTDESGL